MITHPNFIFSTDINTSLVKLNCILGQTYLQTIVFALNIQFKANIMYLYYVQLWLNYLFFRQLLFLSLYYPVSSYYFNYRLITIKLINRLSPNHYSYLVNWNWFSKSFTLLKIFPIKYDHKIFFKICFTLGTIGTPLVYISTSLFFCFIAKREKSYWRSNFVLLNYIFCTIFSNSDVSRGRKVNIHSCDFVICFSCISAAPSIRQKS